MGTKVVCIPCKQEMEVYNTIVGNNDIVLYARCPKCGEQVMVVAEKISE